MLLPLECMFCGGASGSKMGTVVRWRETVTQLEFGWKSVSTYPNVVT